MLIFRSPRIVRHGFHKVKSNNNNNKKIFENHPMGNFQGLPVLIRDKAGLDQKAIQQPQHDGKQVQIKVFSSNSCNGERTGEISPT